MNFHNKNKLLEMWQDNSKIPYYERTIKEKDFMIRTNSMQ